MGRLAAGLGVRWRVARPGLELRERSIATIAMLTALVLPNELASHVRIGLGNGLSRQEIAEVVM